MNASTGFPPIPAPGYVQRALLAIRSWLWIGKKITKLATTHLLQSVTKISDKLTWAASQDTAALNMKAQA